MGLLFLTIAVVSVASLVFYAVDRRAYGCGRVVGFERGYLDGHADGWHCGRTGVVREYHPPTHIPEPDPSMDDF